MAPLGLSRAARLERRAVSTPPRRRRSLPAGKTQARRFIIERILHTSQQSCSDGGVMRRLNLTGLVLVSLFLALPLHAPYAQQSQSVRVATAAAAPSSYFDAERSAADRVTADEMKEILYYIASDDMLGRDTPSPGLDKTAH